MNNNVTACFPSVQPEGHYAFIIDIILPLLTVAKRHSIAATVKLLNMKGLMLKTSQLHMGWVMEMWLLCYPALLSTDSKTR